VLDNLNKMASQYYQEQEQDDLMMAEYYQEQEQDDLMAAFDAPRKEVRRSTLRRRRETKNVLNDFDYSNRQEVNKPTLKSNFYQQAEVPKTSKKSSVFDDRPEAAVGKERNIGTSGLGMRLSDEDVADNGYLTEVADKGFSTIYSGSENFSSDSFQALVEEIKKSITQKAGVLRNMESMKAAMKSVVDSLELVLEMPKYEGELKYITALLLVCYGGSWTMLAGIMAAVEIFGTEEVIQDSVKVGNFLVSEDESEYELSPEEIKETFRKGSLHFALMVAVVVCPSVAEICITIAFACKYSCLVSAEALLRKILITPDIPNMDLEDYFGLVDPEWFDLLSLLGCSVMSVVIFGCFPRLITAMYMGYFGVCLLAEAVQNGTHFFIPFFSNTGAFDENIWKQHTTQYYIWALVAVMAVWQAMNGYNGSFEFVSWCMFLYPVIRLYNIFLGEPKLEDGKKTE